MQTHTPLALDSAPVLSWDAPSHPIFERGKRWYIAAGAIVCFTAVYGIISGAWSFAVVCVLAGGMYWLIHDHRPGNTRIELHDSGVVLGGTFTRWDELAGFWIVQTNAYSELRFLAKKPRGRMVIQTGTQDLPRLRMVLGQRLPELTGKKEGILDIIIRVCKL